MAVSSSRCLRLSKFIVPVTVIILFSAYLLSSSERIPFPEHVWTIGEVVKEEDIPETPESRSKFMQDAVKWEIDGPFDNAPLRDLCSSKRWTQGLIFRCDDAFGGVGNIRNIFLTCIRYAIEAGATTLVIPQIEARDSDLKNLQTGKTLPFTYMFDEEHFTTSLSAACPQMRIVPSVADVTPANNTTLTPKDLGGKFLKEVDRVIDFASEWRELFDQWLMGLGVPSGFSSFAPVLVTIRPSFFEYPILHDSPNFISTFGRILRFNTPILNLSATVLYAMNQKYRLHINATQEGVPAAGKFYGAHLRTDDDAIAAQFDSYEEQSKAYLKEAKKKKLKTIYLASGSPPDTERFTATAAEKGISVTTKYALLEGDPSYTDALEEMKKLTWDQQALIDFMILLRSSHFGGTWASSFSYNIVFKRHVAVGKGVWVPSKLATQASQLERRTLGGRGLMGGLGDGECYKDEVNTVFGKKKMGLWFEVSMWP